MEFLVALAALVAALFLVAAGVVGILARLGLLSLHRYGDPPPPHPTPCRCLDALPCVVHPWRYRWEERS